MDLEDIQKQRQFAPEYSAAICETLIETECGLGNYIKDNQVLKITSEQRKRMVILLEELVRKRNYRIETLFLAVSLADRYLVTLTVAKRPAPCLVNLAVTCLLIAAKLN